MASTWIPKAQCVFLGACWLHLPKPCAPVPVEQHAPWNAFAVGKSRWGKWVKKSSLRKASWDANHWNPFCADPSAEVRHQKTLNSSQVESAAQLSFHRYMPLRRTGARKGISSGPFPSRTRAEPGGCFRHRCSYKDGLLLCAGVPRPLLLSLTTPCNKGSMLIPRAVDVKSQGLAKSSGFKITPPKDRQLETG